MTRLINRLLRRRFSISFVGEYVLNPAYAGYIGGRIEVYHPSYPYAVMEIPFFTPKVEEFYKFRERWDFKDVSKKRLVWIENKVNIEFWEEEQ